MLVGSHFRLETSDPTFRAVKPFFPSTQSQVENDLTNVGPEAASCCIGAWTLVDIP
jgi:hypothetical protein